MPSFSADRAVKHNAAYSADRCQLNSRKLCEGGRFDSRLLTSNSAFELSPTYGVGEGDGDSEADGEAAASVVVFSVVVFLVEDFFGDGDASVVVLFFAVSVVDFFTVAPPDVFLVVAA